MGRWTVSGPDRDGYHRVEDGPYHVLVPTSILDPVLADLNAERPEPATVGPTDDRCARLRAPHPPGGLLMAGDRYDCAECGMNVSGHDYHPYLYCLIRKAGVLDPDAYMRAAMPSLREHFPDPATTEPTEQEVDQ